jgi:hypothetical protein
MLSPTTLAGIANAASPIGPGGRVQPVRAVTSQPTPAATPQPPQTSTTASPGTTPPRAMPRGSLLDLTV